MSQPQAVGEATKQVVRKGIELHEAGGIREHSPGVYLVPSESEEGKYRSVRISHDACSCPSFQKQSKDKEDRDLCKHILAAALFHAKHGTKE